MATKAGTLHDRLGSSSRTRKTPALRRAWEAVARMLDRTTVEPDPLVGWQARAELGRETGARC